MKKEKLKAEELIKILSEDLKDVKPLSHPLLRVLPFLVVSISYVLISILLIGLREDFFEQIFNSNYLLELFIVLSMSVSASFCALWLCVPDMRGQRWMLIIPISLFAVLAIWTVLRLVFDSYAMPHIHFHICYLSALIFGILPAMGMFILSTRGATTQPYMLAFMNGLAIGGLGYIALRIVCISDDIGHICIFHNLPYILFGIVASLIARRIYRW